MTFPFGDGCSNYAFKQSPFAKIWNALGNIKLRMNYADSCRRIEFLAKTLCMELWFRTFALRQSCMCVKAESLYHAFWRGAQMNSGLQRKACVPPKEHPDWYWQGLILNQEINVSISESSLFLQQWARQLTLSARENIIEEYLGLYP